MFSTCVPAKVCAPRIARGRWRPAVPKPREGTQSGGLDGASPGSQEPREGSQSAEPIRGETTDRDRAISARTKPNPNRDEGGEGCRVALFESCGIWRSGGLTTEDAEDAERKNRRGKFHSFALRVLRGESLRNVGRCVPYLPASAAFWYCSRRSFMPLSSSRSVPLAFSTARFWTSRALAALPESK